MKKVLIVDDHPSIRFALKIQLEKILGIERILEADNGQAAMNIARVERLDLIIIDLDIPLINGLKLITLVHAIDPHIKLLVLSGQDGAVYAGRARQAGAHGFISKCNTINEFARATELVLAGYSCFPDNLHNASRRGHPVTDLNAGRILTDKELIILRHLAAGQSNKQISTQLYISNKTVSSHKSRIMEKLQVRTLVELIDYARRHHIMVSIQ